MNDEKENLIFNTGTISTLVLAAFIMNKGEVAVKATYAFIIITILGGFFLLASFAEMKMIISSIFSALWVIIYNIGYLIVALPVSFFMAMF